MFLVVCHILVEIFLLLNYSLMLHIKAIEYLYRGRQIFVN